MLTKLDSQGSTCIGEFVSSNMQAVLPAVSSPADTEVDSTSTVVNIPTPWMQSPATTAAIICFALRGDADQNLIVDFRDILYTIDYIFRDGDPPEPMVAGDVNCDGKVDFTDILDLIDYIFRG